MPTTEDMAQSIAEDIWTCRKKYIESVRDIKWYVAEEASNHGMDEFMVDRVTTILTGRLG